MHLKGIIIFGTGVVVGVNLGIAALMKAIADEKMIVSHNLDGSVTMNYREGTAKFSFPARANKSGSDADPLD